MKTLLRLLAAIPVMVAAPLIGISSLAALLLSDLLGRFKTHKPLPSDKRPNATCATVVIPNWNGRDLLEKYIPPLLEALAGHPKNELLVVDNGSEDGSAAFLAERFPSVKVLALPHNLGFGGGSNAGFAAAKNDIVVLLNSDMRVDRNFLSPLLEGFSDEKVFAVSCQIFFSDPEKHREETGLTEGWWDNGRLWVGHRIDEKVNRLFPPCKVSLDALAVSETVWSLGIERRVSISLRAPTVVGKSPVSPPSSAVVRTWISRSLVVSSSDVPVLRISTLARIGKVWRRSTMPATACSALKTLSWVAFNTIMSVSFALLSNVTDAVRQHRVF